MTMGAQDGRYRRVGQSRSVRMIASVGPLDDRCSGTFIGTSTDRSPCTATLPLCQPVEDRQPDHGHKEEGKDHGRPGERGVDEARFPLHATGPDWRRCCQADCGSR
jgi:hypothetical protein